jgi:hypothetical protein
MMVLLLVGLPPLGIILTGKPVSPYLEFPPLTRHVVHAPFSWTGFAVLATVNAGMLLPLVIALAQGTSIASRASGVSRSSLPSRPMLRAFPWWGWLGVCLTGVSWAIAWNRFEWVQALQPFTFSPLWLGYILIVNGLALRRSGHCMLVERPRYFLSLFPLSAALWWFFEYLNRFVQNWYYVGIEEFGPVEYALYATPPFATVLPAVLGTKEWLETFPRLQLGLRQLWRIRLQHPKALAGGVLLAASLGLMGLGIWPDGLYPLLWVSPLLLITSLQTLRDQPTIFAPLRHGDWRPVYIPALAALICGFFWEMWNFYSAAKWVYAVPYAYRYLIFEMPLVGYGGYLPFGLECAVIGSLLQSEMNADRPD